MFKIIEGSLQLFADGSVGAATGTADGSVANATDSQYAADTGVNTTEDSTADAEREANYKAMISGEYKDIHEKYFEKSMSRRLKNKDKQIAELNSRNEQISPLLDMLAVKYSVSDPTNIEAIMKAAEQDSSYYEDYAMQHGVDTDTAKQLIRAERIIAENNQRAEQEREMEAFQQQYDTWMKQADDASRYYPSLDFDYEINNELTGEDFRRLLNSGVPVKMAYEVVHHNEVMGGAMQFAYDSAQREMADARTARINRPRENGTSAQQASAFKDDMTSLSKSQRKKLKDAVSRGEKVSPENFRQFI